MRTFGKYEVLEKIGVGGFGEVFKGFDPLIKRYLAIKTCLSEDPQIRERFFREAEIAGNLQHRNITTLYDFGIEDGVPYLVQEFLSGEDLDKKIKRGEPISYGDKLLYLLQVARGLDYAHSKGVVHRDIKPGNVHILGDGTAKIMDFGIAKLLHQEVQLTKTGMTVGTAAYLAPEQIQDRPVDHRADIFAFGVLAYELLSYRRPFQGESLSAVLYQIVHEPPPPLAQVWPGCPTGAAAVVERCLEKEAERRYKSCGEIVVALSRLRSSTPREELSSTATAPLVEEDTDEPGASELDLPLGAGETAPPGTGSVRLGRRTVLPWIALGLVVVAAGVGLYFDDTARESLLGLVRGPETPAEEAEAPDKEAPLLDVVKIPAGSPGNKEAGDGPGAEGADVVEVPPEVEPPPPPPPPPPQPATLVVSAAWTGAMTVSVAGGRAVSLERERSWQLDPGRHQLTFELKSSDYSARRVVPVDLAEGETRRLEAPIVPPCRVTVQPHLGSPPGVVRLDGNELGTSPIQARAVTPGTYRLTIGAVPGQSGAPIERQLELPPGGEVVVTFDLGGAKELLVLSKSAED